MVDMSNFMKEGTGDWAHLEIGKLRDEITQLRAEINDAHDLIEELQDQIDELRWDLKAEKMDKA